MCNYVRPIGMSTPVTASTRYKTKKLEIAVWNGRRWIRKHGNDANVLRKWARAKQLELTDNV